MNSNENFHKRNTYRLPTIRQLREICECYGMTPNKKATLHDLLCLLDDENVKLELSAYDGPQVEFQGAIIHWVECPETSISELDSSSDSSNDLCCSECIDSGDCLDMSDTPTDTEVVNAVAMEELYPAPSDFDVQQEVEVEADEC